MAKAQAPSADGTTRRRTSTRQPAALTAAIKAAQDKQARDIVVLDLRTAGGFTDYFLICTGQNARQIATIAEAIQERLKEDFGERPSLAEGTKKSEWVLLDYFNFVVHIFSPECRAFYSLERLWGSAERREVPSPSPR
jgi:ribosome-associated protein